MTQGPKFAYFRTDGPRDKNAIFERHVVELTGRFKEHSFGKMWEVILSSPSRIRLNHTTPFLWVSENHFDEQDCFQIIQ